MKYLTRAADLAPNDAPIAFSLGRGFSKRGMLAFAEQSFLRALQLRPGMPHASNALGQLKFVMYNEHNIYLHDTNAKSRFNSQIRAASHGCIRTKDVVTLATMLLEDDNGSWTSDKIQKTLAEKKTVQANFVKPLPVYIVYFSAAANVDGSIVSYEDVYKRDNKVIAALLDAGGKAPTKKPAEKVAAR